MELPAVEMYACPKCKAFDGFVEILSHCVVTRRVDAELNHVETVDWEPTDDSFSVYYCISCGAACRKDQIERG